MQFKWWIDLSAYEQIIKEPEKRGGGNFENITLLSVFINYIIFSSSVILESSQLGGKYAELLARY